MQHLFHIDICFILIIISCTIKEIYSHIGHEPPFVSGVRVETNYVLPEGQNHYTASGESIVQPNTPITIVIFGYLLDRVEYVTFTDSVCSTSEYNISSARFDRQTDIQIAFVHTFPEWNRPWKLCIKERGKFGELQQIDDDRTWIVSNPRKHTTYMNIYLQIAIVFTLFAFSALCSGLNLGLLALTEEELELMVKGGNERDAKNAKAILPVRRRSNHLLCTLLIVNVIVNAAIAILFEDMASGTLAFVLSSVGIVVFGEIVPQSACVKYGLAIGARTIFITKLLMILTFPLSWPVSKLLDVILGKDIKLYNRERLVELLKITSENETNRNLAADIQIAVGAIEIAKKNVKDVMTKIEHVFMLSEDDVLDNQLIEEIIERGYSRIPVYEGTDRNKIKSFVMIRDFVLLDKKSNLTVKVVADFHARNIRIVDENMPVTELLDEFKTGKYHMAMVLGTAKRNDEYILEKLSIGSNDSRRDSVIDTIPLIHIENKDEEKPKEFVGLITLEDIVEEILQSEIVDESDSILDNVQRNRRQFTKMHLNQFAICESLGDPLSFNMRTIVIKWLQEHHDIFTNKYFEHRALENLIQRNIRQVIISHQKRKEQKPLMVYEYLVPSKRFILILEGKAKCFFPNSQMSFEIGPWASFGDLLIEAAYASWKKGENPNSIIFKPDFELSVNQSCKFLQIPLTSLFHSLRISKFARRMRREMLHHSEIAVSNDDEKKLTSADKLPSPSHSPKLDESRVRSISAASVGYQKVSPYTSIFGTKRISHDELAFLKTTDE